MTHNIIKTDNYLLIFDNSKARIEYYLHGIDDIIAHLPLNGSPILEGVDLLPPLEDDVDELAIEWIDKNGHKWSNNDDTGGDNYGSFKAGYNKAKEKYKYTEEQVREVIGKAQLLNHNNEFVFTEEYLIESLKQPKYPIAFECKIIYDGFPDAESFDMIQEYKLSIKTTTNSQGQTVWVGKYK